MNYNYSLSDFGVTKHEDVLKNGLRVVFIEKPFAPIHACIMMRAGSIFDPRDRKGLAHFSEHILAGGSKEVYKEDFWGIMESIGGLRNATTSYEWMSVFCEVAERDHLEKMRQHFIHALTSVNCSEEIIQNEQKIIISEIAKKQSDSHWHMYQGISDLLSQGSAWRSVVLGTTDSVSSITAADVENFFSTYCCVENMVLVVAGGCTWQDVEKTFSDIAFLKGKKHELPDDPATITDREIWLGIDSPEVKVLSLFHRPESETRDSYLLHFALSYFHNGLTSYFYKKIRNDRGLAYSVGYRSDLFQKTGYTGTMIGVPRARVEETFEAIRDTYAAILEEGISQQQIDDKIDTMWFSEKRTTQRSIDWVNMFTEGELYPKRNPSFGPFPDIFNYRRTFKAEEINEVLRKYIALDNDIRICTGIK